MVPMTNAWPYVQILAPAMTALRPAGQIVVPIPPAVQQSVPPATNMAASVGACPAPPHCPTLPSSESAYNAVSRGDFMSWLKVGRDMILRGALIWTGIVGYDKIAGREDPYRLQRAIAGAVGIEFFVLAWTWYNAPKRNA